MGGGDKVILHKITYNLPQFPWSKFYEELNLQPSKVQTATILSAEQSSTGYKGTADKIVRSSGWKTNYWDKPNVKANCTHTRGAGNLKAYLDGRYEVTEVELLNRSDCCNDRIKGVEVIVGDYVKRRNKMRWRKRKCGIVE